MSSPTVISTVHPLGTEQLLMHGLEKWNHQPGGLWNIHCEWDAEAWQDLKVREAQIFDGRRCLANPGPFKRLGAFAVLNQYAPSFRLLDARSRQPLDADALALWVPRVTLWLQPFYGSSLAVAGRRLSVDVGCPTPHFQVDLIGYLRSVFRVLSRNPAFRSELGILTERIVTLGLIVEAAAYAVTGGMAVLKDFIMAAGNCLERCEAGFKDEQIVDLIFNDPHFLTDAIDIGVN